MRKTAYIFTIALFAMLACNKVDPVSESEDCTVSFNLIGEILTSEEPLTRAEGGTNDLLAILVYQESDVFAWGIFDHLSGIKLNLKHGNTYSVRIAKVSDAKTLLGSLYSLTNDGISCYGKEDAGPFRIYNSASNSTYFIRTNIFNYAFKSSVQYYSSSTTTSASSLSPTLNNYKVYAYYPYCIDLGYLNGVKYPTCNDWFYGEASGFTPNGETMTWEIPLKRVGFKLKYEISGVTDGEVSVTIKNNTRTFFQSTTTTPTYVSDTQFIAFYDAASAWKYADNYMENMTVSVSWARGIGVTQNLGSKAVSIKRNCLNNIKITLGNDDRGAGVSLTTEDDTSMSSLENTVTLQ